MSQVPKKRGLKKEGGQWSMTQEERVYQSENPVMDWVTWMSPLPAGSFTVQGNGGHTEARKAASGRVGEKQRRLHGAL